ncbi:two-component system, OmpR family, KDP operon response regulator KdpE [Sphingobium sp. AP50]|uniref:response regulator n=1 Tax=Sphingobium sp. AP50 TaxID=1884369 RepID=UPI0008D22E0A|nr:response regulator transcription factor [Sphingobium sp. AP50]SEJ53216.1 two-component system, OmpR family, KDP operon response regulator KdpE [Sphingobium sp. AP50]
MKLRHKVLVVDDEPHIRKLIHTALTRADYAVIEAANARQALERLKEARPDISLLDLGLPDRDGLELVPIFKQQSDTTLIIVSAREATDDKVAALDLGADDYLTKPFDTEELLARVRVALRNRMARDGGISMVRAGDVEIDLVAHIVRKGGREVHLTPKEYGVLAQLAKFPGRVITHQQIMAHVWPAEQEHHVEYLRVLVRTLRQKLEDDPQRPRIIGNELGIGYRLRFTEEGETEEFAP